MSEENNKFTLDGKEYLLDDVSDHTKFLVYHLNKLNEKRREVEGELAVLNAAEVGFVQQLRETVGDTEAQPEDVKEGEVV